MSNLARNLVVFPGARKQSRDWTAQELAEFYRVESALLQAGMRIDTDRGLTDEGDPWFVFCREEDGDPVVHFARVDGYYLIASPAYDGVSRGSDFRAMVKDLIARHRITQETASVGGNVHIHPAALLLLVVGAAFFKTPSEAQAATQPAAHEESASGKKSAGARLFAEAFGATAAQILETRSDPTQAESEAHLQIAAAAVFVAGVAQQAESTHADVGASTPEQPLLDVPTNDPLVQFMHDSGGAEALARQSLLIDFHDLASAGQIVQPQMEIATPTPAVVVLDTHLWGAKPVSLDTSANLAAPTPVATGVDAASFMVKFAGGANMLFASEWRAVQTAAPSGEPVSPPRPQPSAPTPVAPVAHEADTRPALHFDEVATELRGIPLAFANVPAHMSVIAAAGSASTFLIQHNILLTLKPEEDSLLTFGDMPNLATDEPLAQVETTAATPEYKHQVTLSVGVFATDQAAGSNALSGDNFLRTLTLFLTETPHTVIKTSQEQYVFYSAQSIAEGANALERMTMTFEDHSSISIVGQKSMLQEILADVL
ncbi:hypothetical protein [Methylocystis echinoides]|uniref:Uncharacterized protein n=1 Tax=Methylocystis echinoides TaxID=29468 RepID=A0A9W6LSS9_9HYPH|nr:hypothetical protein [Methylocystis echinoides]GLI93908.1 hypothetical protein LMG27198_29000 [Methylocystis echinoides]